jgi:tetratricopeptide (TPR) repeat protein
VNRRGPLALALIAVAAAPSAAGETTGSWAKWTRERAESLEATGQYEDAIEEWLALAQLTPDDVLPFSRAAVLAVETPVLRGKELETGSATFTAAQQFVRMGIARGGQGDAGLAYAVGRLYFAERKWAMAWSTLSDAKQWGFDPVRVRYWHYRAAVNRSAALVDAGRAQDAVDELEFLLKAQPGHPEERFLLVDLAAANLRIQQPDVAQKILEGLIAKSPGEADAHYLLGIVFAEGGRLAEAQKCFEDTLRYATATYADQTYRNALLKLCDVQIKLGQLDDAEKTAERFRLLDKDDADGLFAEGRVKQARGDVKGAALNFRRVRRLRPEWLENLIDLQQVLHLDGEEQEADEVGRAVEALKRKREAEESKDRVTIDQPAPSPAPAPASGPDRR